jgi:hypothetical protein
MRVDWLIAGSNSVRLFDEQLRRVMRLPESPTQLAQLHERKLRNCARREHRRSCY